MAAEARGKMASGIAIIGALVAGAILVGCGDDDDNGDSANGTEPAAAVESLEEFIRADYEQIDGDGNGRLDEREWDAAARQDFGDTDVNGDGVLTIADVQQELDETGGGQADRPLSYYLPYDTNDDAEITEQEYLDDVATEIQAPMDTDGDGEITVEEAVAFHQRAAAGRGGNR